LVEVPTDPLVLEKVVVRRELAVCEREVDRDPVSAERHLPASEAIDRELAVSADDLRFDLGREALVLVAPPRPGLEREVRLEDEIRCRQGSGDEKEGKRERRKPKVSRHHDRIALSPEG